MGASCSRFDISDEIGIREQVAVSNWPVFGPRSPQTLAAERIDSSTESVSFWHQYYGSIRDNRPMPEIRLTTIADYSEAHDLTAGCDDRRCGRMVRLDYEALAERYGWALKVTELEKRLRCSACDGPASLTVRPRRQAGPW